ncbi:BQ2448_5410 [Microbotryum intermedium]|uniref:BQ2448_5410 protein n=1 Tax=Microbotryum intermedium TaxID=269621 RepID=A0A238F512_9BASI|nr:BQ2448_5410 [Microbotryum intermedium]
MVSPGPSSRPLLIHPSAFSPIEYDAYSILVNAHRHRHRFEEERSPCSSSAEHSSRPRTTTTTSPSPSLVWQEFKRWIKVDVDPKVEKQILSFYRESSAVYNESPDRDNADLYIMLGMLRLWSHSSTNRFLTRDLAFIQNDEPTRLFVPPPAMNSPIEQVSQNPASPPIATASSNPFRVTPVASPSPPPHSTTAVRVAPKTEQDNTKPSLAPISSTSRGPPPSLPPKRIVSEPAAPQNLPKKETNPFRSSSGAAATTVSPRAVSDQHKDAETCSTISFAPSLPPRKPVDSPVEPPPRRASLKKSDVPSKPRVSSSSLTHRPGGLPPIPPPTHHASASTANTHSRTSLISTSGYNLLSDSSSPIDSHSPVKSRSSSSSSKLTGSTHIGLDSSVRLLSTSDESPHRAATRMARSNSAVSNASTTTSNPGVVGTYDGGIVYERPFSRKISSKTPYSAFRGVATTSKDTVEGMEVESSSSDDEDDVDDDRATVLTDPLPTRSTFEGFSRAETIRPDQQQHFESTNHGVPPPPRRVVTAPFPSPLGNEPYFDDDEDAQMGWGHGIRTLSGSSLSRSATYSDAHTSRRRSEAPQGLTRQVPQRASSLSHRIHGKKSLGGGVEGHVSWTQAAQEGEEWMMRAKEEVVRRTSRGINLMAMTAGSSTRSGRGERLVGVGSDDDGGEEGVGLFMDRPGRVAPSEQDEEEEEEDSDDDDRGRVEPEPPERVKRKTAEEVRREVEREVKKSQEGAEWDKM